MIWVAMLQAVEKEWGFSIIGAGDDRAVLQHVFQVHQIAVVHVLGEIVGIMEMDDALLVGLHNLLGQQNALSQILADLAGHIVALHAC